MGSTITTHVPDRKAAGRKKFAVAAGMGQVDGERGGLVPVPRGGGIEGRRVGRDDIDRGPAVREGRNLTVGADTVVTDESVRVIHADHRKEIVVDENPG